LPQNIPRKVIWPNLSDVYDERTITSALTVIPGAPIAIFVLHPKSNGILIRKQVKSPAPQLREYVLIQQNTVGIGCDPNPMKLRLELMQYAITPQAHVGLFLIPAIGSC
jgi:hypothetical protein